MRGALRSTPRLQDASPSAAGFTAGSQIANDHHHATANDFHDVTVHQYNAMVALVPCVLVRRRMYRRVHCTAASRVLGAEKAKATPPKSGAVSQSRGSRPKGGHAGRSLKRIHLVNVSAETISDRRRHISDLFQISTSNLALRQHTRRIFYRIDIFGLETAASSLLSTLKVRLPYASRAAPWRRVLRIVMDRSRASYVGSGHRAACPNKSASLLSLSLTSVYPRVRVRSATVCN